MKGLRSLSDFRTQLLRLAFAGMTAVCLPAMASAAPVISFDDDAAMQDGIVTFTGGVGGTAQGSGIDFVSIVGFDTPSNPGTANALNCVNCVLSFNTAPATFVGGSVIEFGAGGSFEITGQAFDGVALVSLTNTILEGTFTSAFITIGSGGELGITFNGFGVDTKDVGLTNYFGVTGSGFVFNNTELTTDPVELLAGNAFTANISNADLGNRAVVPEPATLGIFGLGLLGLGLARRRRA